MSKRHFIAAFQQMHEQKFAIQYGELVDAYFIEAETKQDAVRECEKTLCEFLIQNEWDEKDAKDIYLQETINNSDLYDAVTYDDDTSKQRVYFRFLIKQVS